MDNSLEKELEEWKKRAQLHQKCWADVSAILGEDPDINDLTVTDPRSRARRVVAERDEALEWVKDLQSGMYINCVYCGHRYGPKDDVPDSMADVLKRHVEQCPKHPMSRLRDQADDLARLLEATWVVVSSLEEDLSPEPRETLDEFRDECHAAVLKYRGGAKT